MQLNSLITFAITAVTINLKSVLIAAQQQQQQQQDLPGSCRCDKTISAPVCDIIKQVEYPNECFAMCAGLNGTQFTAGECNRNLHSIIKTIGDQLQRNRSDCICTLEYAPVCSLLDGKTEFGNRCTAYCAGLNSSQISNGRCNRPPPIPPLPILEGCASNCTDRISPVCAADMRTEYMNSCFAVCAGTKNFTMGRCQWEPRADCICNKNYSPVCVAGWRTYGNRCAAQCEGFTEFTIGKC